MSLYNDSMAIGSVKMTYGNWRDLKREKAISAKAHKRTLNQTSEQAMSGVWKVKDLE
jgi:hypothetical protein